MVHRYGAVVGGPGGGGTGGGGGGGASRQHGSPPAYAPVDDEDVEEDSGRLCPLC